MSKRTKITDADIENLADRLGDLLTELREAADAIEKGSVTLSKPATASRWFCLMAQASAKAAAAIALRQTMDEDRETVRRLYEQRAALDAAKEGK